MKQLLIVLSLLLSSNNLFACMSASQNRLFPIGYSSKGLCAVETHLYRTELREKNKESIEMKPAWHGISYFKIYDKDYKAIYTEIIDTIQLFEQQYYDSIITKSVVKGLKLAKSFPDFVVAKLTSMTFCKYQDRCSKAKLLFDTINNKISISLSGKIKYDVGVLFDSASIASNVLDYFGGFDDADLSAKGFKGNLYINSIRQFQIGNKKLTIVHIGCGQNYDEGDPQKKEYTPEFAFTDINDSIFEEPVLHHGHGFDYYIWE